MHPTKNYKLEIVLIDKTFPDYIQKNITKYNDWIAK